MKKFFAILVAMMFVATTTGLCFAQAAPAAKPAEKAAPAPEKKADDKKAEPKKDAKKAEPKKGPPFGVEESEITAVLGAGMELLHLETPQSSVGPRLGRERLALFRKGRAYASISTTPPRTRTG